MHLCHPCRPMLSPGDAWHVALEGLASSGVLYGFRVHGNGGWETGYRCVTRWLIAEPGVWKLPLGRHLIVGQILQAVQAKRRRRWHASKCNVGPGGPVLLVQRSCGFHQGCLGSASLTPLDGVLAAQSATVCRIVQSAFFLAIPTPSFMRSCPPPFPGPKSPDFIHPHSYHPPTPSCALLSTPPPNPPPGGIPSASCLTLVPPWWLAGGGGATGTLWRTLHWT